MCIAFHTSTINFNQSVYKAYKSDGVVQPVLFLTSALSYDVTVQDRSAALVELQLVSRKYPDNINENYQEKQFAMTLGYTVPHLMLEIQISSDNISKRQCKL